MRRVQTEILNQQQQHMLPHRYPACRLGGGFASDAVKAFDHGFTRCTIDLPRTAGSFLCCVVHILGPRTRLVLQSAVER